MAAPISTLRITGPYSPHRSPHLGVRPTLTNTSTPPAVTVTGTGKKRRIHDAKPPLPPATKSNNNESRCSSVDRILDSPVKKNARLLDADMEGIERKARSVEDLLEEAPQSSTRGNSPSETFAGTETITVDHTSKLPDQHEDRTSRQGSVLSTDDSIHSTDSEKRKHFLGKYVKKMKNYLKK